MSYSTQEVQALVEWHRELRYCGSLWIATMFADLSVALRDMPPKEYHAVLLCGLLGLTNREAGAALGVSHVTANQRYAAGLTWIAAYLNGERD